MKAKIFLLITDDPDDHVVFSSALDEISTDAVLVSVGNCQKARLILEENIFVPYGVLINLLMDDGNADQILNTLASDYADTIRIAFGGEGIEFNALSHRDKVNFLQGSISYADLRQCFSTWLQA